MTTTGEGLMNLSCIYNLLLFQATSAGYIAGLRFFKPGEVRVADDNDFQTLKTLCSSAEGWREQYRKSETIVWTRATENSNFHMFKVRTVFKDVSAAVAYDVLHDPDYRKVWDKSMIEGYEICCINPNNDIGYFARE